jgi:hypothetical protein
MRPFCVLAVAVLAVGLPAAGAEGEAAVVKSASVHPHTVHGVVVAVNHKHDTFTVRVHHPATATGKPAHFTERKFHANGNTTVEVVNGKQHKPRSFGAVHRGEHVVVHTAAGHPHLATRVVIHHHHQLTQLVRK